MQIVKVREAIKAHYRPITRLLACKDCLEIQFKAVSSEIQHNKLKIIKGNLANASENARRTAKSEVK
jgi:hypothetical protein